MVKSKKLIVSSLAIAGATLIASQHNLILNNSIFSNFTSPVVGFAAPNPEWAPHPEHGKVVDLDSEFSESGFLGTLYEDGTYIMRPVFNNKGKLYLDNPNGGIGTMFHFDWSNLSKIKTFKIEGNIIADKLDLASSGMPSTIDLTGLTLSEKATMPFLSYRDDVLRSITFDPNFSLSNVRELDRMFDESPNLKLSNEQVSQLLKNVRFESYSGRMFSGVGVERLDLSTFDNSRLKITESVANKGYENEGHVFKNLIGLNEIVFGDSFSFENYNPKGTKLSFFDTNLSGVKKVTLSGVGTGNHKFVKDWLTDVKKAQLENSDGLYRNGQFVMSVEDALKSRDDKIWESGIYTLGPVLNLNKKEPTVEHKAIPSPVIYEKDETREKGQPNITVNGEPGEEVITTTYSVDPQTGTITPTVGKPVRVKEPTETVVKVAAKDKVVENEIPNRTRYVKDSEKDYGTENETQVQGHPGREVIRTIYTINQTDGSTTENTTTTRESEPQDKVVRVGGKTKIETTKDSEGRTVTTTTTYTVDETTGIVTPNTTTTYGTQKDSTEVHKSIPSPVRYEKDTTRNYGEPNQTQNGQPGDEVTTTTYSVDPQTGTITPTVGKPVRVKEPTETVVKVAAKDKVVENEIPNRTRYVKDSEKDYGTENETQVQGHPGREVTRTVYTVNPTDGSTTENTTTTRESEPQDKVVRVGGKTRTETTKDSEGRTVTTTTTYTVDETTGVVSPTITKSYGTQKDSTEVHKPIPSPVRYEKDTTRKYGEPNQTQNGQPGDEVTTTTYSVNPQDGTITSTVGKPVRVKEPTETVVKVAAKDKVVENEIPNRTLYVKDSEKDYGTENETEIQGQPGREVTRTVYTVNPNDGFVTERSTISRESDPKDKVVKVGGKTKTEIVNEGNQTYKVITSYDVNSETGEVTSSTTKELISNENHNRSVEVDDTNPVTIPENNNSNNSTPSLKPKDEDIKPKVEKEVNKEILKGSFVENNVEKKDINLNSKKEEKEKTSKEVLTIEKLQEGSLDKINLDNNVQTISLNKSNNVDRNLKLSKPSSTSTDSSKAEILTANNKTTSEASKVENNSTSKTSEKGEKTPTVKAPINTGSHSETNILPILGLIGLSGALIVGSSRKRKED